MPYFQLSRNQLWTIRKNEKGARKIMLLAASTLFYLALALTRLVLLRPSIFIALLKGLKAGLFTPIKRDGHAGGPGRRRILGFSQTIPLLFSKIIKHSK
jgi:hypothetical protein